MGIKKLAIKGFRSLRNVSWEPGRLNVLIGPNGSGKSNLLDACALLQEAAGGRLAQGIVRRGGLASLLWDEREGFMTWNLTVARPGEQPLEYHLDYPDPVPQDQSPIDRDLQQSLTGWSIHSDLRVDRESPLRQPSVPRPERRIAADGQNLIPVLHTLYSEDRELRHTMDAALCAAFGRDYEELSFPLAADQRIQLFLRWHSLKSGQPAANLSDGTLRFLLLVAILANPESGDLIAIDKPETGLHPSMFPVIAELAAEAAERSQVIFTTHSSRFLDAFRDEPPTTTVAEWVDGETRLSVIDGEELRRWLDHYSLGALFRSGELEAFAS